MRPVLSLSTLTRALSLLVVSGVSLGAPGCSAVVNPDVDRVGGRTDAGPDGMDAGPLGVDAGPPGPCAPGEAMCGGACVDPRVDPAHCGGCGFACQADEVCSQGDCQCRPGTPGCSPIGDPDNCGPTGARCNSEQWCIGGRCQCRPGFTPIGTGCVDLSSDPDNCGSPGNICRDGVCAGGLCVRECPGSTRQCGASCVFRFDPRHCGECERACEADQVCVRGDCRDYEPSGCNSCPCEPCGERRCCPVGDLGAICVNDDGCPGGD